MQYAEYAIAIVLAGVLIFTACDYAAQAWHEWRMRRRQKRDWAAMQARIEYWQTYDRQFSQQQKRIRRER